MDLPAYPTLKTEIRAPDHAGAILLVTLDRPDAANAINTQMGHDLLDLWTRLVRDPEDIRCVVVTGGGARVFCAGGDLKERDDMSDAAWRRQHALFELAFWTMMECPVPIIAAVNGHAYGGGLEMVLAVDFAYGVPTARFALPEATIGIMPGAGGTQNLPRIVGERRAKELILTGRPFSALDAEAWGVLNGVCAAEDLLPTVLGVAASIAANAPLAIRQVKKSIHEGLQMDIRAALRFEVEAYNRLTTTEDRHEGVRAFNEKRKPVFRGC